MSNQNNSKTNFLPLYRSRVTVEAIKIKNIVVTKEPILNALNISQTITELMFESHPSIFVSKRYAMLYAIAIGGYYVREESGIEVYCTPKQFESTYCLVENNTYVSAQWTNSEEVQNYPTSKMTYEEFVEIDPSIGIYKLDHIKALEVANAAIKHAIISGQVTIVRK